MALTTQGFTGQVLLTNTLDDTQGYVGTFLTQNILDTTEGFVGRFLTELYLPNASWLGRIYTYASNVKRYYKICRTPANTLAPPEY